MKFMSSILVITMAASSALATITRTPAAETLTNSQKVTQLLSLQRELGKLEGQVQALKQEMESDKTVRNGAIIISAALAITAGKLFKNANAANASMDDLMMGIIYGLGASGGAVVVGGTGAVKQYQVVVSREDIARLEVKIARIQSKLNAKLAEIKD